MHISIRFLQIWSVTAPAARLFRPAPASNGRWEGEKVGLTQQSLGPLLCTSFGHPSIPNPKKESIPNLELLPE